MHATPQPRINGYNHDLTNTNGHSSTTNTANFSSSDPAAHHATTEQEHRSSRKKKPHPSPAAKRQALLQVRKSLPIWNSASAIRESLRERDVLVLVGETGCGKSTQVPQFLLDEEWCTGCIAITQPRRVAAVSLAKRVADEMGCSLGASSSSSSSSSETSAQPTAAASPLVPSGTVGYAVRFDSSTSANTRIKFMTEGMLLQEMLRDRSLHKYSAVVLDEVHERSVNVDVLLAFLVQLVSARKNENGLEARHQPGNKQPLKLIVMSATAEAERLAAYLEEGLSTEPSPLKHELDADSEASWSGISNSDDDDYDGDSDGMKDNSNSILTNGNGNILSKLHGANEDDQIVAKAGNDMIEKGVSQQSPRTLLTNGLNHNLQPNTNANKISFLAIKGRQYPVLTAYLSEPTLDCVEASLKSIFTIHTKEPLPGDILCFLTGQDMIESLEQLVNQYAENLSRELPKVW